MKIEKLLRQLKIEFIKVNLIQSSLDSIIFFLTSNLLLFVASLKISTSIENYIITGSLTCVFFIVDLAYRVRTYHLELYEENNPDLKEVLRTARDNIDKSNPVSQALFDEVKDRTRKITSESIIPGRDIFQKVIAIGILCFLTVGSGLTDFQISNTDGSILQSTGVTLGRNDTREDTDLGSINGSKMLESGERQSVEPANINFSITGGGESSDEGFSIAVSSQNLSFESSDQMKDTDLELAKKYSLEIKKFD